MQIDSEQFLNYLLPELTCLKFNNFALSQKREFTCRFFVVDPCCLACLESEFLLAVAIRPIMLILIIQPSKDFM